MGALRLAEGGGLSTPCPPRRGLKDMELDTSSIEKRFAYGFLQQLLRWMDISQEFIAHLGMGLTPTSPPWPPLMSSVCPSPPPVPPPPWPH